VSWIESGDSRVDEGLLRVEVPLALRRVVLILLLLVIPLCRSGAPFEAKVGMHQDYERRGIGRLPRLDVLAPGEIGALGGLTVRPALAKIGVDGESFEARKGIPSRYFPIPSALASAPHAASSGAH
jgi:hypothetical protein